MMRLFSAPSFIAGIVIGALVAGAWFFKDGAFSGPRPNAASGAGEEELLGSASGAVSVADQLAGDSVMLESVTVPPPGVWAAVRELTGKELGNILGAVRVSAPATNVTVPLLRATVPDTRYAVELYRDDGNGVFDVGAESVYVDFESGMRVVTFFKTTN